METAADILDVNTHVSSGEADLTLIVLKPDGQVVGRYRGVSVRNPASLLSCIKLIPLHE